MIIKNAKVVTPDEILEVDVSIESGKIVKIAKNLSGSEYISADGKYLLPAMIDIGVGVMDSKLRGGTIDKLSCKAKVNGFGTVVLSSFCTPSIDNEITLEFAKSQSTLCSGAEVLTLISGIKEEGKLSDISILLKEGAVGIEFVSSIDGNMIRRLMEYAKMYGVKLFCHARDLALEGVGVMNEGAVSSRLGLEGAPEVAESSQVARIGELALVYGVDVVILSASTPRTLELCSQNPKLHAQTSIHHLLLNDEVCDNYNTSGKIWPPLRDEESRLKMLEFLKSGNLTALTSLHTPVSASLKDAVFAEAVYGIDGLSSYLPLIFTYLVKPGYIDMPTLSRLTSGNCAKLLGVDDHKGFIKEGYDADLILFDPDVESNIELLGSPYDGWKVEGRVEPVSLEVE
jgi:dihydroorotase